MAHYVDTRII